MNIEASLLSNLLNGIAGIKIWSNIDKDSNQSALYINIILQIIMKLTIENSY